MRIDDDRLIVLTGAAGFIGSCVLRLLNDRGLHNIVLVDDLGESERWKNLVGKRFLEIVLKDKLFSWLEERGDEVQAIIHLGACSDTTERDANFLLENNTHYSIKLAEYALLHDIRFIYASSAATYGMGELGFSDEHELLPQLRPLNMYGYSKHLFDLWALQQGVLDRMVGLKYFNVFGPNEGHKGRMSSAIVHFLNQVKKEGEIRLFKSSEPEKFSDGEQVRDFIYVKDAAEMTLQFLEKTENMGIFNVGTGVPHTWNDLAEAVLEGVKSSAPIRYIDMPKDLIGKYQNYTCSDQQKSKEQGLLQARWEFRESILDYIQNYLCKDALW